MILVRNVFRLKFGHAREAVAAWKEMAGLARRLEFGGRDFRLLTDAVGPFYTLVFELTFEDLAAYERESKQLMANAEWGEMYRKITPHLESGSREIFNVVPVA